MDFSSYYYYIPLNFYETPEMTLIDHEPNGDSATVLVLALAKIHTRTVTRFPPFDHLAYSEAERDKKTPEVYQ